MYEKIYIEEDLFPREITTYEERDYGYLFYNEQNKDSYDSNHALIYRDRIINLDSVLEDIIDFYRKKDIAPSIYESALEEGYFESVADKLQENGFEIWNETQKYMILSTENKLKSNPEITVKKITE